MSETEMREERQTSGDRFHRALVCVCFFKLKNLFSPFPPVFHSENNNFLIETKKKKLNWMV